MGLEVGTYISDLVITNPVGAVDPKSQGDDHIRLLKSTIKATFPNLTGAVTPTHTELNFVDGVTSAIQTQLDAKQNLSGGNTISGEQVLSGGTPKYVFDESDQGADGRRWSIRASGGLLRFATQTDLGVDTTNFMNFTRSGTSITTFGLTATAMTLTGTVQLSSTLGVTGAATLSSTLGVTGVATFSNNLRAANEAAGDPSYSFTNDTDTGMYLAADGQVAFATAGTSRLSLMNTLAQIANVTEFDATATTIDLNATNLEFAGDLTTPNTSAAEVGFMGMPVLVVSSSGQGTSASNAGKLIRTTFNGTTIQITDANHAIGDVLTFVNNAADNTTSITITNTGAQYLAGTGFGTSGTRTLAPGGLATFIKILAGNWICSGAGLS